MAAEISFEMEDQVAALGVRCACIAIEGMTIAPSEAAFEVWRQEQFARLKARYSAEDWRADPVLQGFRALHQQVGRTSRRYTASPERLIELLLKRGSLPAINVAVDAYNCLSLETRLSLGAHDLARTDGGIALKLTVGDEHFLPLGSDKTERIGAGEYCYLDGRQVLCRLECRQAEATKVTIDSRHCLFIVQGNSVTEQAALDEVADRLAALVKDYCGGRSCRVWPR